MISVIIPLYNKEKSIKKTIKSVLEQSYTDYELIIVDDGSTDNSSDIVKQIKDSRIRYIKKENGGVSSARNLGAKEAKYKWILFLDADDILLQDSLLVLKETVDLHKTIQVVSGGFIIQEERKSILQIPKKEGVIKRPLHQWWLRRIMPRIGNLLITKDAFINIGGFDERISFNEDYEFLLKMLTSYQLVAIKHILMIYTNENKDLSLRKTPLSSEIGFYLSSLSIENKYRNYFIYNQYCYSIKRSLDKGCIEDANNLKKELNSRFSIVDKFRNFCLNKITSAYKKINVLINKNE